MASWRGGTGAGSTAHGAEAAPSRQLEEPLDLQVKPLQPMV